MGETPRTPTSTTTPRKGHALTCTATACATPTPDGLHLCDPHEGELFALLGQIPDTTYGVPADCTCVPAHAHAALANTHVRHRVGCAARHEPRARDWR